MTHRRPEVAAPKTTKVSNWWYAVGFLIGIVAVLVFWWFIFPPLISLFY